jgi:hypothetical protein
MKIMKKLMLIGIVLFVNYTYGHTVPAKQSATEASFYTSIIGDLEGVLKSKEARLNDYKMKLEFEKIKRNEEVTVLNHKLNRQNKMLMLYGSISLIMVSFFLFQLIRRFAK